MTSSSALIPAIVELLTEAYEGPTDPNRSWFIDNEPGAGILPLLETVSAAEASRSVDNSGSKGSTIAANAEHLRWSLEAINRTIRGLPYEGRWAESWHLVDADEPAWKGLRAGLRSEFETLRQSLHSQMDLRDEYLLGMIAMLPHAAFHLGLIRQMIERVRQ